MSNTSLWDVVIDIQDAFNKLGTAEAALSSPQNLYRGIAQALESATEANFAAQGRPSWVPLAKSTLQDRLKRNNGSSALMILQDSGRLAASISSDYGSDFALIGASAEYAAIHQLGGEITRPAHSTKVRLRTDAKGNLMRQAGNQNLAVFAKDSHKRARESWHEVGEYTIKIPARPYLPFRGSTTVPELQAEARTSIMDVVELFLRGAFGQ